MTNAHSSLQAIDRIVTQPPQWDKSYLLNKKEGYLSKGLLFVQRGYQIKNGLCYLLKL